MFEAASCLALVAVAIEARTLGACERWYSTPGWDGMYWRRWEDFPIRFNGLKDALKENGTSTFQSCGVEQSVVCSIGRVE